MNRLFILFFALFSLFSVAASAQEIPVPASEPQVMPAVADASNVAASKSLDAQLIEFFDELEKNVKAQEGNCEAMVDAMKLYCQNHRDWITSLDYASVNVSEQTANAIHEKSIAFGKLLSTCFDEKSASSIPSILSYCAN